MTENKKPLLHLDMRFDNDNENDIMIANARTGSIRYDGLLWLKKPSAESIPDWYTLIGRVGHYRFYVPNDPRAEGWLDNNAGYFVWEDM